MIDLSPFVFPLLAPVVLRAGSPVGVPQKVRDVLNGNAYSMLPVADTA